jgi:hypothetical protein
MYCRVWAQNENEAKVKIASRNTFVILNFYLNFYLIIFQAEKYRQRIFIIYILLLANYL